LYGAPCVLAPDRILRRVSKTLGWAAPDIGRRETTFGGTNMKITCHIAAASAFAAASLCLGSASAQTAAGPAAATPIHALKLTNGDSQGITAIYASPPGKNDWGDDLLGKQTADVGRTVTLSFKNLPPDLCKQDLQMLMSDGKTISKGGVDICQTPVYRFTR
jgi:hypothetical protein